MVTPPPKLLPASTGKAAEAVAPPRVERNRRKQQGSWLESPPFPASVYQALPTLLVEGCGAFQSGREKDVFLLAAIGVLSGCFPSVTGIYDGAQVRANLFAFVVAPPSSGKGALTWARILGVAYHKSKTEASEQAKTAYDQREAESRVAKQAFPEPPPPYQTLFIPGNTSSAAFIKALKENEEIGIICETEADTLSGALKQDWGDYSDLLRKAFHHESVSYLRKSGERYEIEQPAISVVLAGTPGQVGKLIPSVENGLFSRFLFYCFETEPVWRDVSPKRGQTSLNEHFGRLANKVKHMATDLEQLGRIGFELTPSQWRYFNQQCPELLADAIDDTAPDFSSSVYRLGLVIYRLAMVLSVLGHYERESLGASITCEDTDFATAMTMAKVLIEHSKLMYATMPRPGRLGGELDKWSHFLAQLPTAFDRSSADQAGKQAGISERSVTNYLTRLVKTGQIQKTQHGKYQKA